MLILLFLLYVCFGVVARAIFPLVTPILQDLRISFSQMGFILGSWQLFYIPAALAAGTILDRWGIRTSIFAGALIIGLSASLRYFADGFSAMLIAVALFGIGGPMISVGGPKTIALWFRGRSRGTAMGIYTTGNWVGGLAALSLTNSLVMPIVGNNWRLAFVVYGLITFGIALQWILLARGLGSNQIKKSAEIVEVFSRLGKIHNVRILLIMGLCAFAITHGFSSWLPRILEESGMSASRAGFAAAITIAAGIPSILTVPSLVPSRFRGISIAFFAVLAAVILLLVIKASGTALYIGLAILGFISAPFMSLMLLILMDTPDVELEYMGSAGGMFFCVAEIGGFTGPFFMGVLVDATGAFMAGVFFLASLCAAVALLTCFLKK
jgi:cyanate permease